MFRAVVFHGRHARERDAYRTTAPGRFCGTEGSKCDIAAIDMAGFMASTARKGGAKRGSAAAGEKGELSAVPYFPSCVRLSFKPLLGGPLGVRAWDLLLRPHSHTTTRRPEPTRSSRRPQGRCSTVS